ncbi:AEC family transporter [Pectinatus sottacetonis]|uniref:AEC family transporter n=1 Tax=Pectinatus sottacetonis TaxID=1002795 RepID=UPI0018C4A062|nr:AEC family transporter [Pectinatus sottacetonis]
MSNLLFSLNATIPIFLLMLAGMIFRKIGLFDENFITKMNKFVFVAALPALLFIDISTADFYNAWDTKYVLFCFSATFISVLISFFVSLPFKNKISQGEFIQASYRSSASIIGMAFIKNIYGNYGLASLMIIGTVPLYNVMAVIVLAAFKANQKNLLNVQLIKKTVINVLLNPIILGIVFGIIWSLLKIPIPIIVHKTISSIAALATPLGLMAMGGAFKFQSVHNNIKPIIICSIMKLFVFCILFLPVAVYLGFTQSKLIAALVMLGSATTVSSYIMARNMGHDGILTAGTVMFTTIFSAFSLTFWLFILKMFSLV